MYKKIKKLQHKARDFKIESMCSDLIDANPNTLFILFTIKNIPLLNTEGVNSTKNI